MNKDNDLISENEDYFAGDYDSFEYKLYHKMMGIDAKKNGAEKTEDHEKEDDGDDKPIEIHELKELIELTKQLSQDGDVYYIIFSKAGFHENAQTVAVTIKNIMLISLEDILPEK